MATLRSIKNRIGSVEKIRKIAKAMEIVARTRLRKIEQKTQEARDYFDRLRDLMFGVADNLLYEAHPFLRERSSIKKSAVILVASDKGLCGNFNATILSSFDRFVSENPGLNIAGIAVGKKSETIFKKRKIEITVASAPASLKAHDYLDTASQLAEKIAKLYLDREVDQLVIIYNKFKMQFLGSAEILKLLPLKLEGFKIKRIRDYIYEPDAYAVLDQLLKEYLTNQIGQVILESNAAEEMARMLAMKQARDNANEVIDKLNLSYHKARQSSITRELVEITTTLNA